MLFLTVLACSTHTVEVAPIEVGQLDAAPVTIFVVRHAEKAGTHGDVELTEAGSARARALATVLKDVPLKSVRSTDTIRTRNTAAPSAKDHGLEVTIYDPRDMEGLLTALVAPGPHLVVGHSNTAPGIVKALGGQPGVPIEELEFDRLYVVTRTGVGPVASSLLRYGATSVPAAVETEGDESDK